MKVKHILIIECKLNPYGGGVQRVSYVLGEEFRKLGYGVWYAFYIKETDTNIIPDTYKLKYNIEADIEDQYKVFAQFIKENHIDTLFCQNVYTPQFCQIYARLKNNFGLKIIACLHANPDKTVNKDKLGLTFTRIYIKNLLKGFKYLILGNKFKKEIIKAYNISDRYVLLSKYFIPIMQDLLKDYDTNKLRGINNPCALPLVSQISKENIVLVVGRMEEQQKRISNVLKVWKSIAPNHLDWNLKIVGDGPDLSHYKHIAKKMKLQNIFFEGHSDNVLQYYQRSKIFLMTSIWEGFGMTLIEAQNSGCVPVVFDNFAAVHDIIDGSNGVIVESNNLENYILEVEKLMNDPLKLSEMAKNAQKSSQAHFSKEKIVTEWLNLFKELENEN